MNDSLIQNMDFNDLIKLGSTKIQSEIYISLADIITSLVISLICALIISFTYSKVFQGVIYQKSYTMTIVLITLITTAVTMVISGNLILSLGMVGALSIVRFRTAIKEPLDVAFIFWGITIGIANGVAFFKLSIITVIFFSAVLYIISKISFSTSSHMLILKHKKDEGENCLNIIKKNSKKYIIRSKSVKGDDVELIAEVKLNIGKSKLLEKLAENLDISEASIMSHSNNPLDI